MPCNQDPDLVRNRARATLDISDLRKSYSLRKPPRSTSAPKRVHTAVEAVRGISLSAYPGEVTVLLGANGAGKTSTLACAQGLLKPDAGRVSLLGQDPWLAGPQLRARVGIMLQDGGLPQSIKPIPLLKHIASMYRHPANIDQLITRLGIASFNSSNIRRLSGGQKQRVALAAALAGQPDLLFLDEPSAGLDPQSRKVVFDLINEEKERGVTIILTTHLLDDAQQLADYVYILEKGKNVLQGTVSELLSASDASSTRLTLTLKRTDLSLADLLPKQTSNTLSLTKEDANTYVLTGQFTSELLLDLMDSLNHLRLLPDRMELAPRTLEDVFFDVAGRDIR